MRRLVLVVSLCLCACAPLTPLERGEVAPDILLLGEQHDADAHPKLHQHVVQALAARGQLAAVALEMSEQGHSTAGLPRNTDEATVRDSLGWDAAGWPWPSYRAAVMTAVRAGVPVIGANLPRSRMRSTMADASLDTVVSPAVVQAQREAVIEGHCGLLPETQVAPMARVQIARDRAMAQTLENAFVQGKTVVLIAGARHVDPEVGVPVDLPKSMRAVSNIWPQEPPKKDYCAELRSQFKREAVR